MYFYILESNDGHVLFSPAEPILPQLRWVLYSDAGTSTLWCNGRQQQPVGLLLIVIVISNSVEQITPFVIAAVIQPRSCCCFKQKTKFRKWFRFKKKAKFLIVFCSYYKFSSCLPKKQRKMLTKLVIPVVFVLLLIKNSSPSKKLVLFSLSS